MKAARRSLMTLVCLALVASGSLLQADEVRLEGHDLQVRVDWRWVGGDGGGYYPLRIEAVNKGAARNVEFAFVCRDAGYPGARRTLELDAGATTRFTLLVPLRGIARPGISRFPSRGRRSKGCRARSPCRMPIPETSGPPFSSSPDPRRISGRSKSLCPRFSSPG